jgi:hypothetical protein
MPEALMARQIMSIGRDRPIGGRFERGLAAAVTISTEWV